MPVDAAVQALTGRGLPESPGTSRALWQDCAINTNAALCCPFVRTLADGSLPK